MSAPRNCVATPFFDFSGSDGMPNSQPKNSLMSKSFTNSDSALPLSYTSTPQVPRAPSLPPSNTSKYSTDSDTNVVAPEVPIRSTSSPRKLGSLSSLVRRDWVLEKITKWLQLSTDNTPASTEAMSCSFIVMGGPGTGKTTLFNHMIRNGPAEVSGRLLAYHACSNQFTASINIPRFILSLRDQIVARRDVIGEFYRKRLAANGGRLKRLFTSARLCAYPDEVISEAIFKVLGELDPKVLGGEMKLFFAIDAADECLRLNPNSEVRAPPSISSIGCSHKRLSQASSASDHNSDLQSLQHQGGRIRQGWVSRNLMELLAVNSLFLPPWIGLLITCRRDSQAILRRLFRCASTAFLDDMRSSFVVKDLNEYIAMRLKADSFLQNTFTFGGQDTLQILQYKSNGSFLYLQIVLTAVSECWLAPEYIKTVPGTINGLFLWLSQRLLNPLPNDPSTSIINVIKPVLNLVLATPRPLTLSEVDTIFKVNGTALHIAENWKKVLILPFFLVHEQPIYLHTHQPEQWVCRLDYTEIQFEKVLSLAHTSFRDWFLDVKYSTPVYLASARDGHTMLALTALSQIKNSRCLPESLIWNILYNFTRSSLYSSSEALQELTASLKDVKLDFSADVLANLDCWTILQDPILVHCSFAGSSISQLIEDALNYEHRSFEPTAALPNCNGTRTKERTSKQPIVLTGVDKETSIGQLCTAAFQGRVEIVKGILAQGNVDIESRDAAGSTPLVLASRQGHLEIVKCLLEAGARLDQIDQDGWSALRSAAWGGHLDVVKVLLDSGVDVDMTGPDSRTAMRAAAWAGHVDIVRLLLVAGADVNRPDAEGRTPLIAAAYMGCVDVIDVLAEAGANLNHADHDGRTALCVAAYCVAQSALHTAVVAKLLQLGADPNLGDRELVTPLIGAAHSGRRDVCELCLEADANVDALDKSGRSALVAAVVNGHVDVVQLLLFWCAAVDTIDANGRSVLSIAAACGHTSVVRQLLDRGLDEGHRDHMGATPLHLGAAAGHADVVRLLLESGSRPEEIDNVGQTPLLVACQADHTEVVKLLLQPVVSLEARENTEQVRELFRALTLKSATTKSHHSQSTEDPQRVYDPLNTGGQDGFLGQAALQTIDRASMDGRSPLRAAALNNNIPLVKLLLALGADPDQQDLSGRTTLSVVVLEGLVKMTKVLLFTPSSSTRSKKQSAGVIGANPMIPDDEGRFPLHIAAWQGDLALLHLLLQVGTPVDVRDKESRTPLHSAAWQNHSKTCTALIEVGANINAVCNQGASALCIAAQEGHYAVCEVLLQHGANALQVDAYGRTPFKVAMKAGHGEICALLERYGAAPPPTSPLSRQRLRKLTPVGAPKASQHTLQRQKHQQQHQQFQNRPTKHGQSKLQLAERDQITDPGVSEPGGHPKMGCTAVTNGSTLMIQQKPTDVSMYARPSISFMNAAPAPPPHMKSSRSLLSHQQQSQVRLVQQQPGWSPTLMTLDSSQWQPFLTHGLQFPPTAAWCPNPQGAQSLYSPPVLFAPQVQGAFDCNPSQQPLYQPAYVLSPQGILVPAQAPYFVPQFQPVLPSHLSHIHVLSAGISPRGASMSVPPTGSKMAPPIEGNSAIVANHNQRPPSFSTSEDPGAGHHLNIEAPPNPTFSGISIASPIVSETVSLPCHYSTATPTLQEDSAKPLSDRPTIQLIVNTKLGEDVINLNEVTDSEYESSIWVSRRQVTVLTESAVERGSKSKRRIKNRQSMSPERHHHGSKVKAAIQGALKGARRKKAVPISTPNTPGGAFELSTVPTGDKKAEKQQKQELQQNQQQKLQMNPETHI